MKLQIISMICKPKKHIYFQVSWLTVGHNCIGHCKVTIALNYTDGIFIKHT